MGLLIYSCQLIDEHILDLTAYAEQAAAYHAALHDGSLGLCGWVDPRRAEAERTALKRAAARIGSNSTALVSLGVGGSYLGIRAAAEWLTHCRAPGSPRLYWGGWNLSGLYHQQLLQALDREEDVSLCVISKLGGSIETQAAFRLLKSYLSRRYGAAWRDRVYVVTDPQRGGLRAEAEQAGYTAFAAPPDVAGRYSLLTPVGLLPLAAAGVDIDALLAGAVQAAAELNNGDLLTNPCYQYAAAGFFAHRELGKTVELFAVTEPQMSGFARWLKQLFAEGEGKRGKGIFPVDVLYSGDLHTMGQFFAEGAPLFFETLIYPALNPVQGGALDTEFGYPRLDRGMRETVIAAHSSRLPLNRLALAALDEQSLGYACYFFMKVSALRCLLLGNHPFDQPAVEAYKREMRRLSGEEV